MLGLNPIKDLKQARLGQKLVAEVLNYDSVLSCQLTLEVSEPINYAVTLKFPSQLVFP